jgi:2-polyprenyl-6-hydroxyphenyl methylase / 3-demethylubiquinone-9 3-methyltransferase
MNQEAYNVDPIEVRKFDELASRWWDPDGEFKPLHKINPLRIAYIQEHGSLGGKKVLDVGCGGGLLSEGMAKHGAIVTGIDMAPSPLAVARLHRHKSGLPELDYFESSAEQLAMTAAGSFDIVTCMEVIEHVPDPVSLVNACAQLVRPGGSVFLSTLNRNVTSFMTAIVAAEYLLRLLPRGTHEYERFIKPSELRQWGISAGLHFSDIRGIEYSLLSGEFALSTNVEVNYLMHFVAPA